MEIDVLDHGYVKLIEFWGTEPRIIESARMSTNKGFEGWDNDFKLLKYLFTHRHTTPFEMCGMTIEVKAPIFVFREWHRHRTQSFNEMSARYIPMPNENYLPSIDRLMMSGGTNKQAQGSKEVDDFIAADFQKMLLDHYKAAEFCYAHALHEMGIPKELARLIVPVGRYSKMRASANLVNWLRFLSLRLPKNAQWEIRQYAEAVQVILGNQFPLTMGLFRETGTWK